MEPVIIRGLANKKDEHEVYTYMQYIVSMDDDDPEMRCGRLDLYFQATLGEWYAVTTTQIFKKSWVPNESFSKWTDEDVPGSGSFDPKETIVGKKCYMGLRQGAESANKTTDTSIVKPGEHIATVIAEQGILVILRVEPAFTARHEFETDGFWCEHEKL